MSNIIRFPPRDMNDPESDDGQPPTGGRRRVRSIGPPHPMTTPQEFVDIVVGPNSNPVKFSINQDLLFHRSPAFKACFESQWEEGQENSVRLDEVDVETFGMVWNFGDKYLIAPLQNKVIDAIHFLLDDEYLDSPEELKNFVNHAFPTFENNNDQNGNRIGASADLEDCNMVQLLIVHKFALGHWGIGDVELRNWIEGNHLPYSVLGKISMVMMKNTLYGTLEAQRAWTWDYDNYHVQQR